jgi:hypothetical protein
VNYSNQSLFFEEFISQRRDLSASSSSQAITLQSRRVRFRLLDVSADMRVLGSGFRRIDDKKDLENKKSRSYRKTPKDQSILPIIKFEDSTGVSPANSANRWETIEHIHDSSQADEAVRHNSLHWSSRTNPDTAIGDFQERNPRNDKFNYADTKYHPASRLSQGKLARKKVLSQPVAEVFDPFSVDDNEVYHSIGRETVGFDNCRRQSFAPSRHWQSFTENSSMSPHKRNLLSNQNEYEHDYERQDVILETKEDFERKISGSTFEFKAEKEDSNHRSHYDHEFIQGNRNDDKERDIKASRTQEYLESLSVERRQASAKDPLTERKIDHATHSKNRQSSSRGVSVGESPRNASKEDIEIATSTSFPDRVDPLEFLKEERDSDKLDIYSDQIFMKFDCGSCDPMQPRVNLPSELHHAVNSRKEMESDDHSESEATIRPVEIATGVSSDSSGVEVIEVQTIESGGNVHSQYQDSHAAPPECTYEYEYEYENQDHEGASNGDNVSQQLMAELHSPTFEAGDRQTPGEYSTDLGWLSRDSKRVSQNAASTVNPQQGTPQSSAINSAQGPGEDKLSALQKFVRMATPVLNSSTFSLGQDETLRNAAEKLGIPLSGSPTNDEAPDEEQIELSLNVDVRSNIELVQQKISSKHSIHFPTTKSQQRNAKFLPSASTSLLDSASEVSDLLHNSSQSTSSSIMPKKLPPAIDLTTVNSGGSLSALTFHAQSSQDSDDTFHQPSHSDDAEEGVQEIPPQKLVGRNEADSTRNVDKPEPPRGGKNLNSGGMGKSASTHQKSRRSSFSGRCRSGKPSVSHRRARRPSSGHDLPRKPSSTHEHRPRSSLSGQNRSHPHNINSKPLGATVEEIEMINKFLSVAGPYFDGAHLSCDERAVLYEKALQVGIEEDFVNRLLDQSAGILLFEQRSMSTAASEGRDPSASARLGSPSESTVTGRSLRTKDTGGVSMDDHTKTTIGTSYSECTYDEDGFNKKTPKTEANFSCLTNIFWMESSNIVGDDMLENVQAVMSADSDLMSLYSKRRR